jgi:hypothetical protein
MVFLLSYVSTSRTTSNYTPHPEADPLCEFKLVAGILWIAD